MGELSLLVEGQIPGTLGIQEKNKQVREKKVKKQKEHGNTIKSTQSMETYL